MKVRLSSTMRNQMPGIPVKFCRLAMFKGATLDEYMSLLLSVAGEAVNAGHDISETVSEAWRQDDGSLLVVVPAKYGSHRTMLVPRGQWELVAEPSAATAPTLTDIEDLVDSMMGHDPQNTLVSTLRRELQHAVKASSDLQETRQAYEDAHPRGGLVILDKSKEGLVGLQQFIEDAPWCARFATRFRDDVEKHYLIVYFSKESRTCVPYAFANAKELLDSGLPALATKIGGDLSKVGIGTSLGHEDAQAIMEYWEALGGGRPFGKPDQF